MIVNTLTTNDYKYLALTGCSKYHLQGYYGDGITVGVIDSGVNQHPEFEDRLLLSECKNFTKYSYINPENIWGSTSHGTSVASLIAGKTLGVAPKAKIISLKVVESDGSAYYTSIITALRYVRDNPQKFDIINISITGGVTTPEYEQAIKEVVAKGILVVCAAGNSGITELLYPAAFDDCVSVGAVDILKKEALFSTANGAVDLAQIGVNVPTAYFQDNVYDIVSGTSFASPLTAGIAVLIACKYKKLFNKRMPEPELYTNLMMNSVDIGTLGLDPKTGVGLCTLGLGIWTKMTPNDVNYTINGIPKTAVVPVTTINFCTMVHIRMANEQYGVKCFSNADKTIDMIG